MSRFERNSLIPCSSLKYQNIEEYIEQTASQVSGLIKEIESAAEILKDMIEAEEDTIAQKLPDSVKV